jgi:hypothetical protein|nr:MAG TPA: hypothetical protein [Caudoviricetes sp.]
MTTHLDRLILIDQIKQRLLSISNDHFTHVTDTIFGLLNISKDNRKEDNIQNIRINKQRVGGMIDISLLERYSAHSYLKHVEETLDKLTKENTKYLSSLGEDPLKKAIFYPTVQMLNNDQFPIPPLSNIHVDDPSYIDNTITLKDLPCFTLTNHFDDNNNIIDSTYTIIALGRKETIVKINETTKELIFLIDNQIIDLSRQTDVDIFIHDLTTIIKEIFTYLNTSYLYRKNSLSLKTNQE